MTARRSLFLLFIGYPLSAPDYIQNGGAMESAAFNGRTVYPFVIR
jgi:hypothetical protein